MDDKKISRENNLFSPSKETDITSSPEDNHFSSTFFYFCLNSTFFLILGMIFGIAIGLAFLSGNLQVSITDMKKMITLVLGFLT